MSVIDDIIQDVRDGLETYSNTVKRKLRTEGKWIVSLGCDKERVEVGRNKKAWFCRKFENIAKEILGISVEVSFSAGEAGERSLFTFVPIQNEPA